MALRWLLATVALLLVAPAAASDARLETALWQAGRVVLLPAHAGFATTVEFPPDERITNIALGDGGTWQITPNRGGTALFVRPLRIATRSNLTVITSRHTYFFDLVAARALRPLYGLRFLPAPEAARAAVNATPPAALTPDEAGLVGAAPKLRPVDPAALDHGWRFSGDPGLAPAEVWSTASETWLIWPARAPLPAILLPAEPDRDGRRGSVKSEQPVNFAVRDGALVIAGVPPRLVLRSGDRVAALVHQLPAAATSAEPSR